MSASRVRRLIPALSIVLPTAVETSFLRACLGSGAPARQAWASYRERAGDLRTVLVKDRRGLKKLMPLLLRAVERNGLDADPSLLTVLRTAHLRATLRSKTVRRIVADVLRALTSDGIPHVVLDGVALVGVAYTDPALRHCSTIDLLMRPGDRFRAVRSLSALTITPGLAAAEPITLRHGSGLPVELRSQIVSKRDHPIPLDGLLTATTPVTIDGIVTRVLSPPDRLLDICLRAFFRSGAAGLGWVPDAWHVLHRSTDLDWDVLLERSRVGNLALPLWIPLRFLTAQLDAPVPAAVLDQLWQAVTEAEPIRVERALGAAVAGTPDFPRRLLAIDGGWGSRFAVAKWMVLPTRGYLRSNYQVKHAWQLPFYYLYRPLRFVARRRAFVSAHPPNAGGGGLSPPGEPRVAEGQARVDQIRWYHEFDFPHGIKARSREPDVVLHRAFWSFVQRELDALDFRDKTVLDVGCWDGYWSFYAERRGARSVLASDDRTQNWAGSAGLLVAKELLGSSVETRLDLSVYQLRELGRTFDIILCLGVYYHLVDPVYAFAQIRHCCHPNTIVVVEGIATSARRRGTMTYDLSNTLKARFAPSVTVLNQMLKATYLDVQRQVWRRSRGASSWWQRARTLAGRPAFPPSERLFTVCRPFEGVNALYFYPPPFGLHVYDDRFRPS